MRFGQDGSNSGKGEGHPVRRKEAGQVLTLVLILLLFGGLLAAPLLAYMHTAIKSGSDVEGRVLELYAADSGFEDALLKISRGANTEAVYPVDNEPPFLIPDVINGKWVQVTMEPKWMMEGIESDHNGTMPHAAWVVAGRLLEGGTSYEVTATFDGRPPTGGSGNVRVDRVGVYLPAPYKCTGQGNKCVQTYVGSDKFTHNNDAADILMTIDNGTAYIWEFDGKGSNPDPVLFPEGQLTTKKLTFTFSPSTLGGWIGDFSWARTKRTDIYLAWSPDVYRWRVSAKAVDPATGLDLTEEIDPATGLVLTEVRGNLNVKGEGEESLLQSWDTRVY